MEDNKSISEIFSDIADIFYEFSIEAQTEIDRIKHIQTALKYDELSRLGE